MMKLSFIIFQRNARWEFKVTGNAMKGTLMYKGDLYRIVHVSIKQE